MREVTRTPELIAVDLCMTEADIVENRAEAIAGLPERYGETIMAIVERFGGPIAHREALHTAHILAETVDAYLTSHPCVIFDARAYRYAAIANAALRELYQRIGVLEHQNEPGPHADKRTLFPDEEA